MKRIITAFIACMLLTCTAGAVDLYVDTNKIVTDTPPAIVDGRTLVPVRAIFEAIGATVEWDNTTRTATGAKSGTIVSIQIDNTTAYVNGGARTLDVPAQLINNRTMVPARFISEALGCDVTWDQKTRTVGVADKTKGQHIYVTATGAHYHYSSTCNGGTYYEATLAEAMGRGLEPCDKCVLTNSSADNTNSSNNATLPNGKYKTTVLRVIDGDTFVVNYNGVEEKVRLIGVDTPKSVYSGSGKNTDAGFAASEFTTVHLTGKEVELEFDVQQQDQYGHLLAYAYVGGEMFNEKLLKTGYSNIATNSQNVKYIDDFKKIIENRDQSIPSGEYYDGYMKAPSAIYRLPKALNGMSDAFLYDDGLIINLDLDIDAEYDCIFLQTNRGTIALLNAFDLSDFYTLKHGDSKRIGFMYVTSLESSNVPVGVFIETLSKSADFDIPDWLLDDTPTVPTPPSWNTSDNPTIPSETPNRSGIVYVSKRSNTIHSVSDCGGMKNYREMNRSDADAKGYKYCPNCW